MFLTLNNCEYDVIKNVITNDFNFMCTEDERVDFDIIWHNTGLKISQIKKLKSYQKYNHFPGMYQLARKTNLGRNLMKMCKLHPEEYGFFPKTWILPNDYNEFLKHYKAHENKTYIVKPDMNSQGRGIYLTKNKDDINSKSWAVIQEYVDEPFLVDNLKFDIRLYVLILSVDPLRIYIYDEGLVRFATVEYQKPTDDNMENTYIHLTNYAINKHNENFVCSEDNPRGHKRSLKLFWEQLKESGIETGVIKEEINDVVVKTLVSVQPQLAHQYRSWFTEEVDGSQWFELLGFDIMLDENLDPILIEVNHAPSFATDAKLDLDLKRNLIHDTFKLLNMSLKRKNKYKKEQNKVAQNRIFTGRKEIQSVDDKERLHKLNNIAKHKFETANTGGFYLVYPVVDENNNIVYDPIHDYSLEPLKWESKAENKTGSEDSTSDGSKNISDPQPVITLEPKLTENEKLARKYQKFIDDAYGEWEDFTTGFKIKNKNMMLPEDHSTHEQLRDRGLNSRNPVRNKNIFQSTARNSSKTGFGTSAKRIIDHGKWFSFKYQYRK